MAQVGIGEIWAMKTMSAREAKNSFGLMIDTARAGPASWWRSRLRNMSD